MKLCSNFHLREQRFEDLFCIKEVERWKQNRKSWKYIMSIDGIKRIVIFLKSCMLALFIWQIDNILPLSVRL